MVKLPKDLQKKYKKKRKKKEKLILRNENLLNYFDFSKTPMQRKESDLRLLEEMLLKVRYANEKETEISILIQIGETYKFLGPMDKSIEAFRNAIRIAKELGNIGQIFFASFQLGNAYLMQGSYYEALQYTLEAYQYISQDENLTGLKSTILQALGEIYSCLGENKKAIVKYDKALYIAKQNKEGELVEGSILMALAKVKRKLGTISDSISFYQQALIIMQKLGEKHLESSILLELSANYDYLGEIKKAIEFAEKSRKIYINIDFKIGIGTASYNLGGMLFHYGDKERALKILSQSLKIFKEINNPLWSARVLWYLKEIYLNQGNIEEYEKARDDALVLMQKTESSLDLGEFMIDATSEMIPRDYEIEDENEKAEFLKNILGLQKKSLETFQNTDSPQLIGKAMTGIGYTYAKLDNYTKALKFYNAAISIYEHSRTIYFLAITYTRIGELYQDKENPTKALEHYNKSLNIYQNLLKKLEGTNLYFNFKTIFNFLPKLIEDIKETIYNSCFMENQFDTIENTKSLAIEICKKVKDTNLKQLIPKIGRNPEAIKEILTIAENRAEEIRALQAEITIIKNNHEKDKDQPNYYENITKRINTVLRDRTPFIDYWQKRLKINNYNQLCEESKDDLIAFRMIMVYLDDYLEICLFQCTKVIEREIQQKIFESFRKITNNLNQFTFLMKSKIFSRNEIKSIERSHSRLLSYLKGKVKLTLGDFSYILEHTLILKQKSVKVKLLDKLNNFISNSFSYKEQEDLVKFLVKPFDLLNISDLRFKDIRFNDLRNYIAHPKDSTSKIQLTINKTIINRLIDIITDKTPYILSKLSKF